MLRQNPKIRESDSFKINYSALFIYYSKWMDTRLFIYDYSEPIDFFNKLDVFDGYPTRPIQLISASNPLSISMVTGSETQEFPLILHSHNYQLLNH